MNNTEFVEVMGYLTAGSGKDISAASKLVYFDCLRDMDVADFRDGAKVVLMEHKFATFPSIAELREAATKASRNIVSDMTAAEAWAIAWRIVGNTDPEVSGSFGRASRGAPELVLKAIDVFGLTALCYGSEPVGVIRGQFLRIYEQLAARQARIDRIPASLKARIEGSGIALPSSPRAVEGKNGAA